MTRLDSAPEIVTLASELGIDWRNSPVRNIVNFCLHKIALWLKESGPLTCIVELQELACQRLSLVFEEVWDDEDLDRIIRKYVNAGEPAFAYLKRDLDEKTYATLLERHNITGMASDRYVAVIDCRGEKAARRFFSRWHEIAHLLTLVRQLELPFTHRSQDDNSPLERMMDTVAGEIGFYEPLFSLVINDVMSAAGRFSFGAAEQIRTRFAPEASFQSTLFASIRFLSEPVLYVEAAMGLKKHEQALERSRQMNLLPIAPPVAKLRVVSVIQNEAAKRHNFRVDRNMMVPSNSLIATHFGRPELPSCVGCEDFSIWRHSNGQAVGRGLIHIETRFQGNHVVALVQPAAAAN